MPAAHTRWTVLAHGPIVELADNLWRVEGVIPDMPAALQRAMTLVRLGDGRLVIHNAMALEEAAMRKIEAWGRPAVLIVPNGWHRLDARIFRERYPELRVVCPAGARKRVSQVVDVDCDYEALGSLLGSSPDGSSRGDGAATVRYLDGCKPDEGVLEVRSSDGESVVFNDLVNNLPRMSGGFGFIYRFIAGTGKPGHHRLVTRWLVHDRRAFAAELERYAARPALRRVLVSHGAVIEERAGEVLRAVAASL